MIRHDGLAKHRLEILDEDDDTKHLEPSGCRTCTSSDCHDDEGRNPERRSPHLIVIELALEAARRYDGHHVEDGCAHLHEEAWRIRLNLFGCHVSLSRLNSEETDEEDDESHNDVAEPSQLFVAPYM